ncbi:MAG TPA: hypothetical protein VI194_14895 [Mycobacterium sp.]
MAGRTFVSRPSLDSPQEREWAESYAETARRWALDAWVTIAEILQPSDPDEALSALETTSPTTPINGYLYQRVMRLQAAASRPEAVHDQ